MNSLPTQMASPAAHPPEVVLVREGGVAYAPSGVRDPFQSLMALMEVVEALCPRWPERVGSLGAGCFRL